MRDVPEALAAHLSEGATTLCRCWRLVRHDGAMFGFTDHDRDLLVAGETYRAASGLEAHEVTAELGFATGGGEVSGALTSEAITEADIAAGLYDGATVEELLVNWADPAQHVVRERASIGEIRRQDGAFVAELRGPMHRLDEESGRRFRSSCPADLGDARCRVDLDAPPFNGAGSVIRTGAAVSLAASGLGEFPDGWFTAGRLRWLTGSNAGTAAEVRTHAWGTATAILELWQRAGKPIQVGDTFQVTAGCDKRFATCRDRFGNTANFRGFPHMPGNDFVVAGVSAGDQRLDGGSLFQ